MSERAYRLTIRMSFLIVLLTVFLADKVPAFSSILLGIAFAIGLFAGILHFCIHNKGYAPGRDDDHSDSSGVPFSSADPEEELRYRRSLSASGGGWSFYLHDRVAQLLLETSQRRTLHSYYEVLERDLLRERVWLHGPSAIDALPRLRSSTFDPLSFWRLIDVKYPPQLPPVIHLTLPPSVADDPKDTMVDIIRKLSDDRDIAYEFEISSSLNLTIRPVHLKAQDRLEHAGSKSKGPYLAYSNLWSIKAS